MKFLKIIGVVIILSCGYGYAQVSVLSNGNLIGTYPNIQDAIAACPVGGTVLVTSGTYTEGLYINKNIAIVGQGTVNISVKGIPDVYTAVIFDSDKADGAVISGFIITGAEDIAIECRNGADAKIINNTISGNWSGIVADSASPTIANNLILRNESDGIICWHSSAAIINNTISYNAFDGIYLWNSSSTIINNIITKNGTGSIYSYGINSWASSPYIDYNCVWGNGTDTTGDGIGGNNYNGTNRGSHDISQNPQFIDDFCLQHNSPCIDKGTNTAFISTNLPMVDKNYNERIVNDIIDMGAYEFQLQHKQYPNNPQ